MTCIYYYKTSILLFNFTFIILVPFEQTLNDVITGIIFFGTRLYMQSSSKKNNAHSTALVLLNTRNIGGYKSVKEMVKPDAESPWGN